MKPEKKPKQAPDFWKQAGKAENLRLLNKISMFRNRGVDVRDLLERIERAAPNAAEGIDIEYLMDHIEHQTRQKRGLLWE